MLSFVFGFNLIKNSKTLKINSFYRLVTANFKEKWGLNGGRGLNRGGLIDLSRKNMGLIRRGLNRDQGLNR